MNDNLSSYRTFRQKTGFDQRLRARSDPQSDANLGAVIRLPIEPCSRASLRLPLGQVHPSKGESIGFGSLCLAAASALIFAFGPWNSTVEVRTDPLIDHPVLREPRVEFQVGHALDAVPLFLGAQTSCVSEVALTNAPPIPRARR